MRKKILRFICLIVATVMLVAVCSCARGSTYSKRQFASKQSVSSQNSEVQSVQSNDILSQVVSAGNVVSQNSQTVQTGSQINSQANSQTSSQVSSQLNSNLNVTSSDFVSSNLPVSSITNTSNSEQSQTSMQTNNSSKINSSNITSSNTVSTPKEKYVHPFKAGLYLTKSGDGAWTNFSSSSYLTDEKTYENIRNQGFDHVKLLINFHSMYSAQDKSLNEKNMSNLDKILDVIESQGFYVFIYACERYDNWQIDYNSSEDLDEFVTIWELIAQRYKDRSELIYFALVDEPHIHDVNKLNVFLTPAVEAIRKTNPTRKIVCPAVDGNQAWLLDQYKPPVANDDNLILAVHTYNPGEFTHQGCTWAGHNNGQVRLTQEHIDTLKWDLEQIEKFMKYNKMPVIINAFGLHHPVANEEDTSKFIRIITQFCKDNGIPWAWWTYNNGAFAIYKEGSFFSNGSWNQNVLDALFLR